MEISELEDHHDIEVENSREERYHSSQKKIVLESMP